MPLPVHVEGAHNVVFHEQDEETIIEEQAESSMTNQADPHARTLLYIEFPEHYVWNKSEKVWTPRQRDFCIVHIHFAPPSSGERFYLHTLLTVVRGSTSFKDLRSFQDVEYSTFKEPCLACCLLEDDQEWRLCLQEASTIQTGTQLWRLFVTILAFCFPSEPQNLWNIFKHHICDDLKHCLPDQTSLGQPR